jgi:hypothetical protein
VLHGDLCPMGKTLGEWLFPHEGLPSRARGKHLMRTRPLTRYLGTDVNEARDDLQFLRDGIDRLVDALEAVSNEDIREELTA